MLRPDFYRDACGQFRRFAGDPRDASDGRLFGVYIRLFTHNKSVTVSFHPEHIQGMSYRETQAFTLSDGVIRKSSMLTQDPAIPMADRSRRPLRRGHFLTDE